MAEDKCNSDIMARFLGRRVEQENDCLHVFNPEIVKEFKNDQVIHRRTMKKLLTCHEDLHCKGLHPFQCKNFHKQEQYLKNLMQKRHKAKLNMGSRIGQGMRDDYLSSTELTVKKK